MVLKAIKDDEQRKLLKKFKYVVIALPDRTEMEMFLALTDKHNLMVLSNGDLKKVFNRVRGLLWDNVVARRKYAKKTNKSRIAYQRDWYAKNKDRINEDRRMKRRGILK